MLVRIQFVGCAALVLAACGANAPERSAAKLSEIEWTLQQSGTTTLGRVAVDYDGDLIKSIAYKKNGEDAGRMDFTYGGSLVDKIEVTDPEGDQAKYNWDYGDGRLERITWSVSQIVSTEQSFEYDDGHDGRAKRVTSTTSWAGSTPTDVVASYDYDEQGRLDEISTVEGMTTHTTELRYDDASRIERYTEYGEGDAMQADLSYDAQGRLELVDADDDRYEVSYDADGMIEEILILTPSTSSTMTVRYSYEPGDVSGLTFTPDLPVAGMIDLRGAAFDQADFTSFAPPLDLGDVPHIEISSCAHDVCDAGGALDSSCDSCAAAVCAADSYCCTTSWDSTCVGYVPQYCGLTC